MEKKLKTMCEYKKEKLQKNLSDVKEIVKMPTHICLKCGRVANDKKYLCKPDKLSD